MSDYEQEQDIVKVLNKRINYDEIQKIYATFATFDDNLIWLILNE